MRKVVFAPTPMERAESTSRPLGIQGFDGKRPHDVGFSTYSYRDLAVIANEEFSTYRDFAVIDLVHSSHGTPQMSL
eukprot:scaffold1290_cov112-Skeletonema_dohrnii-CCMP3373.AAC.17